MKGTSPMCEHNEQYPHCTYKDDTSCYWTVCRKCGWISDDKGHSMPGNPPRPAAGA